VQVAIVSHPWLVSLCILPMDLCKMLTARIVTPGQTPMFLKEGWSGFRVLA
jgi:hypothetical protein